MSDPLLSPPHLYHWDDGTDSAGRLCWLTYYLHLIYIILMMAQILLVGCVGLPITITSFIPFRLWYTFWRLVLSAPLLSSPHLYHSNDGPDSVGRLCWLPYYLHLMYTDSDGRLWWLTYYLHLIYTIEMMAQILLVGCVGLPIIVTSFIPLMVGRVGLPNIITSFIPLRWWYRLCW